MVLFNDFTGSGKIKLIKLLYHLQQLHNIPKNKIIRGTSKIEVLLLADSNSFQSDLQSVGRG